MFWLEKDKANTSNISDLVILKQEPNGLKMRRGLEMELDVIFVLGDPYHIARRVQILHKSLSGLITHSIKDK